MSGKKKVDSEKEKTPRTGLLKHVLDPPVTRSSLNKARRTLSGINLNSLTPNTLKYSKRRRSSASNLTPRTLINAVLASHKTVQKETNYNNNLKTNNIKQTPPKHVQSAPLFDESSPDNFSFRHLITDFLNEAEPEITTIVAKKKLRLSKTDDSTIIESDNDITTRHESSSTPLELDIGIKKRISRDHYYITTEDWTHAMDQLKDDTDGITYSNLSINILENAQKVKKFPLKSNEGIASLSNVSTRNKDDETLGNVSKILNISEGSFGNLMKPLLSNPNLVSPKSSETQMLIVDRKKNTNVLSTIRKTRSQSITPVSGDQCVLSPKTYNFHDSGSKIKTISKKNRIDDSSLSKTPRTAKKSLQKQFENSLNISEHISNHKFTPDNLNSHNTSGFVPQQQSTSDSPRNTSDINQQLSPDNQCSPSNISGHVSQQDSAPDSQQNRNILGVGKQQLTPDIRRSPRKTLGHVQQQGLITSNQRGYRNTSDSRKQQLTPNNQYSPHNTSGHVSQQDSAPDSRHSPHNISDIRKQQLTPNNQYSPLNTSGHVSRQDSAPDSRHSPHNISDIRKQQLTSDIQHSRISSDELQKQFSHNRPLLKSTAKSSEVIEPYSSIRQSMEGNISIKESTSSNNQRKRTSKPEKTNSSDKTKKFQALRNISKRKKPIPSEFFLTANAIKSIFSHYSNSSISKAAWKTIQLGSEQFFKNLLIDLSVYCRHGNRFTIQNEDVLLLMQRQKFINEKQTFFGLVEKNLPLEFREKLIPVARLNNELSK